MRTIVCDTGPILHLGEAKLLKLLQKVGKIYIPEAVDEELYVLKNSWYSERPEWIVVKSLSKKEKEKANLFYESKTLDKGEAEAILLAQKLKANWFLTDDTTARVFAQGIGIETHGSLGLILWSSVQGKLTHESANQLLENCPALPYGSLKGS